jgi:hypothetical protein
VEVPATVIVSRPIPRREIPLAGTKKLLSSALPLNIELGNETKTSWIYHQAVGLFSIGILLLPFAVIMLSYLWVLVSAVYETLMGMLK